VEENTYSVGSLRRRLSLALSKRPKRVVVSLPSREDENRSSFRNVVLSNYLGFRTMNTVQKPSDSKCHIILFNKTVIAIIIIIIIISCSNGIITSYKWAFNPMNQGQTSSGKISDYFVESTIFAYQFCSKFSKEKYSFHNNQFSGTFSSYFSNNC
jgi:hypothetical protein